MMRYNVLLFILGFTIVSCSAIPFDISDSYISGDVEGIVTASSVENVLKRAQQISRITWTPIYDVPNNLGVFPAGVEVTGIPYSSVKECDKFVGQDVSFITFMTAVHNPRSVLYTENVRISPYRGVNGATYYGTVCSSAVNYALGLRANYSTSMIDTLSFFQKDSIQRPDRIQLCDVLWSKGHEVMVYNIIRNPVDSSITYVSILESVGVGTRIHGYSFAAFMERWEKSGWVIYRYNFERQVPYIPSPFISIDGESLPEYKYNDIICPSRGDYAVYREGEQVIINILDDDYEYLTLYRDNQCISETYVSSKDFVYSGLPYGIYTVVATDCLGNKSNDIHFEIVDNKVSVELDSDVLSVSFSSKQGTPIYLCLCNQNGGRYLIREFGDQDVILGKVQVTLPSNIDQCYCKVYFSTDNGTVTNVPIPVNRI